MDIADLDEDPLRQLARWLDDARAAGMDLPEAMCLATASPDGMPAARMVLMRGLDHGVVFFTDYESAKGHELGANPRAASVFHLARPVRRQVRIRGAVERVSPDVSDAYWLTRPIASRRSAAASHQSTAVESRAVLEEAVASLGDVEPERPARWGGFRITPFEMEFWEEGRARLHDRVRFLREHEGWQSARLSP